MTLICVSKINSESCLASLYKEKKRVTSFCFAFPTSKELIDYIQKNPDESIVEYKENIVK